MATHWYALRVKPHKERFVREWLEGQKMTLFAPHVQVQPKNPRAAKERPYFPGYLFVQADLQQLGENAFQWVPGTVGLVSFGGQPAVVPDQLIRELRQRIEQIRASGGLTWAELQPGDRIRIVNGPFAGYEAIFDMGLPAKDRVQVLLSFLSKFPQPVQLDVSDVVKVKGRVW
ncbi:MAG: hypothetical protein KJ063_16905 [Anaerolineae bacterium]|nr:hypothetical protein [Anaerolineae bacterium]